MFGNIDLWESADAGLYKIHSQTINVSPEFIDSPFPLENIWQLVDQEVAEIIVNLGG